MGIILLPVGGAFKYFAWDFFNKPQTLLAVFPARIKSAQDLIHEIIFLPLLAQLTDAVIERQKLPGSASAIEILNKPDIYVKVRVWEASKALSDTFALDRVFQGLLDLCPWVGATWLIVCLTSLTLFFFTSHAQMATKDNWFWLLVMIIVLFSIIGGILLFLYFRVQFRLSRNLGTIER